MEEIRRDDAVLFDVEPVEEKVDFGGGNCGWGCVAD